MCIYESRYKELLIIQLVNLEENEYVCHVLLNITYLDIVVWLIIQELLQICSIFFTVDNDVMNIDN